MTTLKQEPHGLLRITVPASTPLLPAVFTDFLQRCGGVQLEVLYTDRFVDLVEESFDIALRAGRLSDWTPIARNLGTFSFMMVASPRYMKRRGRPRMPSDLPAHAALVFNAGRDPSVWHLTKGRTGRAVTVKPALAANEIDVLLEATEGGVGVAMVPAHRCAEGLRGTGPPGVERPLDHDARPLPERPPSLPEGQSDARPS